ncbi:MAG: 1,4-dihydroxy-2-naphthoate polyprenyltransferase [Chloroflexia bacterium]|nr:1,4-dihydroxy-2-naphthoate polyprenyltransferase [Chloroflexia bacterium]
MTQTAAPAAPIPAGSPLKAWWLAIRPRTLAAAVAPIVVGSAVAWREGGFHLVTALVALAVALLLQVGSNLANDVLDFRRGADTADRLGPTRVTQGGLLSTRQVATATGVVLGLATLAGLYLVWRGGWPILLLGAAALVAAVAYTGGPAPLGYLGLGEVFVFLFFGLAGVAGSAYVQTGELTPLALWAAVPIGAIVTAVLVVNNLRDIPTDRAAGKMTLAVRFGPRFARAEYLVLLAVAFATPLGLWLTGVLGPFWWLSWAALRVAFRLGLDLHLAEGRALNPLLGKTARLALLFGLPFAASIVL